MIFYLLAVLLTILVAVVFNSWIKNRISANSNMLEAIDTMDKKYAALSDAKSHFDSDVPNEVMDLANWMIANANTRGIEFILAAILSENGKGGNGEALSSKLRDPLGEVFQDLVHAWVAYVSNKNLVARFLIRNAIGRRIEKDDHFKPYSANLVTKVVNKKHHSHHGIPPMTA